LNTAEIRSCVLAVVKENAVAQLPENFESVTFQNLEIDSLATLEIIVSSMKKLNIKIPRDQYRHIKSPADLVTFLEKHKT
jgi:acyl carrier protein